MILEHDYKTVTRKVLWTWAWFPQLLKKICFLFYVKYQKHFCCPTYGLISIRTPLTTLTRINGVIFSVLASSAVDHGFVLQSCQTKDYKTGIFCFSSNHAALRTLRAKTGCLGIRLMCTSGRHVYMLLFQWASTIKIQMRGRHHLIDVVMMLLKSYSIGIKQPLTWISQGLK